MRRITLPTLTGILAASALAFGPMPEAAAQSAPGSGAVQIESSPSNAPGAAGRSDRMTDSLRNRDRNGPRSGRASDRATSGSNRISPSDLAAPDAGIRRHLQRARRVFDPTHTGPASDELLKASMLLRHEVATASAAAAPLTSPSKTQDRSSLSPLRKAVFDHENTAREAINALDEFGSDVRSGDVDEREAFTEPYLKVMRAMAGLHYQYAVLPPEPDAPEVPTKLIERAPGPPIDSPAYHAVQAAAYFQTVARLDDIELDEQTRSTLQSIRTFGRHATEQPDSAKPADFHSTLRVLGIILDRNDIDVTMPRERAQASAGAATDRDHS